MNVFTLKAEISERLEKIHKIQDQCNHPDDTVECKARSNTGNWDPHDDSYWYELHCHSCDKRWDEDQKTSILGRRISLRKK